MKRALPIIVSFLAVVLFGLLVVPHTLMMQEQFALFLTTPDWMRETFSAPWPLCHLAANGLLQFFYYRWGGPLVLALLVALVTLLLSLPFRGRAKSIFRWSLTAVVLVAALVLTMNGKVHDQERFSTVEYAAGRRDWKTVLATATPEASRHNRELLPYALLALSETGQLPERMMAYPVRSIDDFCPEGWNNRRGLSFKATLYECMGVPHEAIHNVFQAADALPHGLSFGSLRSLVRLNTLLGDEMLADKYRYILGHSTLHHSHPMPKGAQDDTAIPKSHLAQSGQDIPLIVPDYFFNVTTLMSRGNATPTMVDRSLCGLLLRRDLTHFAAVWNALPHAEGEAIPALYQEALLLSDPSRWSEASGPYTRYFMQERR